jgi:2-desacetyl-2-hydroxyethyl bacteriochlorophyllide A dehydrogenase
MITVTLKEPGTFEVGQANEPGDVPAGHALVKVRRIGICGTDWHAFNGKQPFFAYPRVLGHELGVEVVSMNDPTSDLKPGDKCAVEPYLNCGQCSPCRRGKSNCCTDLKVLGVHIDGGMRERIVVPANKLHRSNKLSLDQLALVETLGIGCHAVARAGVEKGDTVLVIGAGPIGLAAIQFVQAAGVNPIVADTSEQRLAFCRQQLKVETTLDARGDLKTTLGELPTVVIDATGNPGSMAKCFELIAHGGRIVYVGLFQGDVTFNDPNFHRREITLMASRNALPGDFTRIIKLVEVGVVDTTPWITHRAACADLPKSIPAWLSPDANLLKAMLEF